MARPQYTPEQRILKFWSKVAITADDEKCWEWHGWKDKDGYGSIRPDPYSHTRTHRFSWMITYGNIPDGLQVLHKCDNPPCCNPKHLFLGTTQENTKDRDNKGRGIKGEGHHQHRLTNEQVDYIREHYLRDVKTRDLATMFGVSTTTIYNVAKRLQWKWRP